MSLCLIPPHPPPPLYQALKAHIPPCELKYHTSLLPVSATSLLHTRPPFGVSKITPLASWPLAASLHLPPKRGICTAAEVLQCLVTTLQTTLARRCSNGLLACCGASVRNLFRQRTVATRPDSPLSWLQLAAVRGFHIIVT